MFECGDLYLKYALEGSKKKLIQGKKKSLGVKFYYSSFRVVGGQSLSQLSLGETGYTLDESPVHHRAI